jgi:hypothetical protein
LPPSAARCSSRSSTAIRLNRRANFFEEIELSPRLAKALALSRATQALELLSLVSGPAPKLAPAVSASLRSLSSNMRPGRSP